MKCFCYRFTALQLRAGQRSITTYLRSMTAHICHVMTIVTGSFSKKLLLLFPRNSFERYWACFFLEFKHIYKTQRTNLFSFSFFNGCFKIILCINILHLFVLFHCVQTHRMSSFFACCFAITLCNKALRLCTWTGSLKPSLKWTFYVI